MDVTSPIHILQDLLYSYQEGLGRVLGCGVLQSAADILSRPQPDTHLHQYKLQTLLHLEMLWVLGESCIHVVGEGRSKVSLLNHLLGLHVGSVCRLLHRISINTHISIKMYVDERVEMKKAKEKFDNLFLIIYYLFIFLNFSLILYLNFLE